MVISKKYLTRQLFFCVCIIAYKLSLDAYYAIFSNDFAYYGVIFEPRGSLEFVFSWICLITTTFFVDFSDKKVSNSVHLLLYLVCFVPSTVVYVFNSTLDASFFYGLFGVFLAIGIIQKVFDGKIGLRQFSLRNRQFVFVLGSLYAIFSLIVISTYGLSLNIPSLSEVYDQRDAFKSVEVARYVKYALSWLVSVVNLALILYATINRKYLLMGFGLLAVLYFFSLGGHKSYLFSAPLALILLVLVKVLKKDFNLSIALFMALGLVLLLIFDQFADTDYTLASSLFVRRSLLLPSQIYFYYCEYYNANGLNFFSHNLPFSLFMSSPYSNTAPVVIGLNYFGFNEGVYANGNVFADVFHNAGYLGYLLISIVLSTLYMLIDFVSKNKTRLFTIPMTFLAFYVLINTGLFVSLITHGIILSLLVIGLYPNKYFRISSKKASLNSREFY